MRILLCTKKDLFGVLILNALLPRLPGHTLKVLLSDKTRAAENIVPELIDEKCLERDFPFDIFFPMVDAQTNKGRLLSLAGLDLRHEVSMETIYDVNHGANELMIRQWNPDVIVSVRFSLIFKANILTIPRFGIYNLHPGALPGYAGLMAPLHALLENEKHLGCTLHQADEGIDTGPIYSVSYLPVESDKSVFDYTCELYDLGLNDLMKLLLMLDQGESPVLQSQNRSDFRYFHLPGEEEFAEVRGRSISMIHLSRYIELLRQFLPTSVLPKTCEVLELGKLEGEMRKRRHAMGRD
jgi:hypothetical protein